MIKSRKIRGFGHVERIGDVENATKLHRRPEVKKQQARWISNLESSLFN
jgi:hypothetical protein